MCLRPIPLTAEPPRLSCLPCYRCASPADVPWKHYPSTIPLNKQLKSGLLHVNGAFWGGYLSGLERVCSTQ